MDEKTKLEWARDAATAISGLIELTKIAERAASTHLGRDYGLEEVIALLKCSYMDVMIDAGRLT